MPARSSRLLGWLLGLLLVAVPTSAAAETSTGRLSPRLQALSGAGLRSAPPAARARAISLLPQGPGSLLRDAAGDPIVEVRVGGDARERAAGLREAGADIVALAPRYGLVEASVPEGDLRDLARAPGVEAVTEELTPMVGRLGGGGAAGALNACAPGVVSEGDSQLRADQARELYGIDGSGVKVGVLSDSFNTGTMATKAANDIASAGLPGPGNPCGRTTPVQVLDDTAGVQADEGRAMLQIVHDLAPGANLAFATAFTGQLAFADNIRALASAGADVIADDIIYFGEPYYQDGIIANAVNDVSGQGVAYFSMAFNNNNPIAGNDSNSWEAPSYRNAGSCPALIGGSDCMDFKPGTGVDNTFALTWSGFGSFRIGLQWAQPQNGVTTNLDLYVINKATNTLLSSTANNATTGSPFEFVSFTPANTAPGNYEIVIKRVSGAAAPRLKWVNNDNGAGAIAALEYPTSSGGDVVGPTIYGHNGTAGAQTVAAVPFSNSAAIEPYSGRGPVTHLFGPVSGLTPAAPLATPEILNKPDVAATDGGINTFFGPGNRFYGTSAAAPHAAAVAALQIAAEPSLSAQQLKQDQRSTARPVGSFGPLAAGAGLIDARAALIAGDRTAPDTTIDGGPTGTTSDNTPTFTFSAGEANASFQCKVDGGSFSGCASPKTLDPLGAGAHSFQVRAVDLAGNPDPTPASRAFTVAPATPDTTITSGPTGTTDDNDPSFAFSSNPGATFECRLDGPGAVIGGFQPCTSPKSYVDLDNGTYTFRVRASSSGVVDPTPATRTFTVDAAPPETTITSGPTGTSNDIEPTFGFSSEPGATFACRLDGPAAAVGSFEPCTSPKSYSDLADGAYTFRVRATVSGAADPTPATRTFTIDATGPVTHLIEKPKAVIRTAKRRVTVAVAFGSEPGASFACRLDGGAFHDCDSPYEARVASASGRGKRHSIAVAATDPVGNAGEPATARFKVVRKRAGHGRGRRCPTCAQPTGEGIGSPARAARRLSTAIAAIRPRVAWEAEPMWGTTVRFGAPSSGS